MARYIIYGAGSVGGMMGARMHLAGQDVVLIARGAHRDAMTENGLRFQTATKDDVVRVPVVGDVSEITFRPDDRLVLGMKTHEVSEALLETAQIAPPSISILCAQNGVESERIAQRLFKNVYGVYVYVLAVLSGPGHASCYSSPSLGILDVGRYPHGSDAGADAIAADFRAAGFDSLARPDVMTWKRGKLLMNMNNPVGAACAAPADVKDIVALAQQEAEACYRAAKLDFASMEDVIQRAKDMQMQKTIGGRPYPGGSTTQGAARGATTSEVDYLNGEIVLMGRMYGVPTPVNESLQALMRDMVRQGAMPGYLSADALRRRVTTK